MNIVLSLTIISFKPKITAFTPMQTDINKEYNINIQKRRRYMM